MISGRFFSRNNNEFQYIIVFIKLLDILKQK